jgi:hypothetical protein
VPGHAFPFVIRSLSLTLFTDHDPEISLPLW